MMAKGVVGMLFLLAALGLSPSAALADEIVHFTNGAEMTVRSHVVEQDSQMVKLDLGGNSFIAFPMAMVDKIVNAGKDVFLNPAFHPSNQAIAGVPGGAVAAAPGADSNLADTTIRGGGAPVGFSPQRGVKGAAGVMLGEVADTLPADSRANAGVAQAAPVRRQVYNPAFPSAPGDLPQVIMPPSAPRPPVRMGLAPSRPPESPSPPPAQPPSDPAPEDPPETP